MLERSAPPRRRAALAVVLGLWLLLALARLTRLVEPPEPPPGELVRPFVAFAREAIPPGEGYLFLEPRGPQRPEVPRLRYELYPRRFQNASVDADEATVQALLAREGRRFIAVPAASLYPPDHWVRGSRPWFRRLELDRERYVLVVEDGS